MIHKYYSLSQNFWFLSPTIYKSKFYKDFIQLDVSNVFIRNVDPEYIWLKKILSQKNIFIEIGSGIGESIYFLDYILFPENIFAFEPHKKLNKRLRNLFPKVNILPFAILNEGGEKVLNIPIVSRKEDIENVTLSDNNFINSDEIHSYKVKCISLDEWVEEKELEELDFIKVNSYGNELLVLEGAENVIDRFKPILIIRIEQSYYQKDIWDVISEIEIKYEYDAHYVSRENFELEKLNQSKLQQNHRSYSEKESKFVKNIIFLPR